MENTASNPTGASAYSVGEGIRDGFNTAVESARRSANRLHESFTGEVAKRSMQETSAHLGSISSANAVLYKGFQDVSREWISLGKTRAEGRQKWFGELVACRTPHDFFEIQTRFWMNNVETLLASSQRVAEISVGITKKATLTMAPAVTTLQ